MTRLLLACVGVIDQQGYMRGGIIRSIDAGATWNSV